MLGAPLDVEQPAVRRGPGAQQVDQRDERGLGGVAGTVEHRLPCEQAADGHAVEPADERAVRPRLDRVRPPEVVQPGVRLDDVAGDPAAVAGRVGAGEHDVGERGVDPDVEARQHLAQRPGHPQPVERQHTARVGRPPAERRTPLTAGAHGEQAGAVGGQQRAGSQVGAERDEVVAGPGGGEVEQPVGPRRLEGATECLRPD
ncbi:hypothetical protein GCM10025868_43210 [Angustibacter aerolatus]|uniref:Uncharacterized protein n=1 Tax=Angustibacter aerolatus TaxID=1162965 RepID=A0ABQ6JNE1_9ACTN|nr:hypothetical protein GCM10025868_43210 [Angustibacter aerolatus]